MRKFVYSLLLLLFCAGAWVKAGVIERKRGAETVTMHAEWRALGKPVSAEPVQRRIFESTLRLSGTLLGDGSSEVTLPQSELKKVLRMERCGRGWRERRLACVLSVSPQPDAFTGLISMQVHIPHTKNAPQGSLLSDSFVYARRRNVLAMPILAVRHEDAMPFVWRVNGDWAALQRVDLGVRDSTHVEVVSGVEEGAVVVTAGARRLKAGDRLRVTSGMAHHD